MLTVKCIEYFKNFSNKDLEALRTMFSDDITLRDWDIDVSGIEAVLGANYNIFDKFETINVMPVNLYKSNNIVICEIEILLNDNNKLLVVDILEFDDDHKIKSIRAYKG
tara:strand:- start:5374 stop:5700 length:327 start_codon:yes stop_codon:yes gene_type:complete